jgi:hypothetical protein
VDYTVEAATRTGLVHYGEGFTDAGSGRQAWARKEVLPAVRSPRRLG